MITQTQFPFGNPIQTGNQKSGKSVFIIMIIVSGLLASGAFFYLQNRNQQNENQQH